MEAIYSRPRDYDLEHEGDDEDIEFYLELVRKLRPSRVLELASGSGRVTIPIARLAPSLGFDIVGLEIAGPMLEEAERKRAELESDVQRRVTFVQGDLRKRRARPAVRSDRDTPCSSLSHLLTLDDQLAAWQRAHDNLKAGGRFVTDLTMPNLAVYAESMQNPPRTTLEIDVDTSDSRHGRAPASLQNDAVPWLMSSVPRSASCPTSFQKARRWTGYVSDFDAHVYYPR